MFLLRGKSTIKYELFVTSECLQVYFIVIKRNIMTSKSWRIKSISRNVCALPLYEPFFPLAWGPLSQVFPRPAVHPPACRVPLQTLAFVPSPWAPSPSLRHVTVRLAPTSQSSHEDEIN